MTRAQAILRKVSRDHKCGISDITGPLRFPYLVAARRDAVARMRAAGLSLTQISRALKRSYSTITHHCYPKRRATKKAYYTRFWANVTPAERDEINRGRRQRRAASQEIHA